MPTAWIVKRKNTRHGRILTTVEFKGDKMTKDSMELAYEGDPNWELLSVEQVDPQAAWKMHRKWKFQEAS